MRSVSGGEYRQPQIQPSIAIFFAPYVNSHPTGNVARKRGQNVSSISPRNKRFVGERDQFRQCFLGHFFLTLMSLHRSPPYRIQYLRLLPPEHSSDASGSQHTHWSSPLRQDKEAHEA